MKLLWKPLKIQVMNQLTKLMLLRWMIWENNIKEILKTLKMSMKIQKKDYNNKLMH